MKKIVQLDNNVHSLLTGHRIKCAAINSDHVFLSKTNIAHVLNMTSFSKLGRTNISHYLEQSRIIVVTDNSINNTILKENNVGDSDYSFNNTQKGLYAYKNGTENVTINVFVALIETETDRIMMEYMRLKMKPLITILQQTKGLRISELTEITALIYLSAISNTTFI